MASADEMITIHSSMQEDEYDDEEDIYDGYDHDQHPHPLINLSRLSVCTSNSISMYGLDDEDVDGSYYQGTHRSVDDNGMRTYTSRLSNESFDADEEFSDGKGVAAGGMSSDDSDNEPGCYSLPATPLRVRNRGGLLNHQQLMIRGVKEYSSENEAEKGILARQKSRSNARRRRRIVRERWMLDNKDYNDCKRRMMMSNSNNSGESDHGGGGGGVMLITRPKGGRRSLCMDLEEVKACRDLGFELEHERMFEMPSRDSRLSVSASTLETSSGGNSPIANWRISSPGDDPRDVKARLKVWAQAVAIASTSRQGC